MTENDRDSAVAAPLSTGGRYALIVCATALAIGLFGALWIRLDMIEARGLYPMHKDEQYITKRTIGMLRRDDLNPRFFRYGSLPIYITYLGMKIGLAEERANGTVDSANDVTTTGYPYYSHAAVSLTPRRMFAAIAVLCLAAAGLFGFLLRRDPLMLLIAPAVLSSSWWFTNQSWTYLNVDIVAASVAMGGLAYLTATYNCHGLVQRVLVPALFCGAITACKYNSGLLGLPFLIAIWIGPRELRVRHTAWILGASFVVYSVLSPYSFLDWKRFTTDVLYEYNHYKNGHIGATKEPGLEQLRAYFTAITNDFKWALGSLGLLGIVSELRHNRVRALLILCFPILVILHLATNRTHFARNALPFIVVYSVFVAAGIHALLSFGYRLGARIAGAWVAKQVPGAVIARALPALVAGICALGVARAVEASGVVSRTLHEHRASRDSRDVLIDFLLEKAEPPCLLMVPKQLQLDTRRLGGHCGVQEFDFADPNVEELFGRELRLVKRRPTYVAFSTWRHRGVTPEDRPTAIAWNAWFARFQRARPVLRTGRGRLTVNYKYPTYGNPQIKLYQIRGSTLREPTKATAPERIPLEATDEAPDSTDVGDSGDRNEEETN